MSSYWSPKYLLRFSYPVGIFFIDKLASAIGTAGCFPACFGVLVTLGLAVCNGEYLSAFGFAIASCFIIVFQQTCGT